MNWTAAAACAVQRGGKLAEIMSKTQNDSIFHYAINKAGINLSQTQASDGGGASYLWIGGNDIQNEGVWIWDGDGNLSGPQFWQGDYLNGNVVGGYYNNWGSVNGGEPDNFFDQDGLGLALTAWPYGTPGQWNDINISNNLFFVVQYSLTTTSLNGSLVKSNSSPLHFYYNEMNQCIVINHKNTNFKIENVVIYSIEGKKVYFNDNPQVTQKNNESYIVNLSDFNPEAYKIYFIHLKINDNHYFNKLIKN
jgi:hypothetical protein